MIMYSNILYKHFLISNFIIVKFEINRLILLLNNIIFIDLLLKICML